MWAKLLTVASAVGAFFSWKDKTHDDKKSKKAVKAEEKSEAAIKKGWGSRARDIFYKRKRMRQQSQKK